MKATTLRRVTPWLALMAVLTGCAGGTSTDAAGQEGAGDAAEGEEVAGHEGEDEGELVPVRYQLNFAPNGAFSYLYYGRELGYFEEEGIDLDIVPGRSAQQAVDAVAAGNVEIGSGGGVNIILSAAQGHEVVSVGMIYAESSFGFLIPDDTAGEGLDALAGASVLSIAGGPQTMLSPIVLDRAGVDGVDLVDVNPAALISTYAGGEGDAVVTSLPFGGPAVAEARPSTPFPFSDHGVNIPDYGYIVSPEYLDASPDVIEAFLRAAYRSYEAALADTAAAVDATAAAEPTVPANEASQGQFLAFDAYRCTATLAGQPYGLHDPEQWTAAGELLLEAGALQTPVDTSELYTNRFFEATDVSTSVC